MSDPPAVLIILFLFGIGACIGSFLNVCIFRLPKGKSIVSPGSACTGCGHRLSWFENIPLLSFVFLKARCRQCGSPISFQYPLVELLNALFYVLFWLKFGLNATMMIYAAFFSALLVITFIDLKHYIIPDVISLPGIPAGLAASFLLPQISWMDSFLGIIIGGGILFLVAWGYYLITKREGMGGGDIKLLAMIGAFLGWQSIPAIIFFSAAVGSVTGILLMFIQGKGRHHAIPYGPFLAGAATFYMFFGPEIMDWYAGIIFPGRAG